MSTLHDKPTHMLENPEQYITRVGRFLRAHSLDELPQIWDGKEVYEIANELHIFTKIDFLDDDDEKLNAIGSWEDIYELKDEYTAAIAAVGDEHIRKFWFSKLAEAGYVIPTLVHPSAIISPNAIISVGSVICARAAISPGASIGNGCIISAGVAVARDATIDDWTHIDVGGIVVHNGNRDAV